MYKIKFLVFALFISFLSSTLIAQVENSAKEKKVKAEKQIEKVSKDVKSAKDMAEAVPTDMKKACGPDCKMECCSTETKEMKAEMKKGEKMLKQAQDCDCEGCKTASTAIHKDHNMMKKSHVAACDCEGCKVAHAEMKENKAHSKDCTCKGCAKT
jgi:hypothetical protein